MPKFNLLSQSDAQLKSSTGPRAIIAREYVGYVNRIEHGKAGSLEVAPEENAVTIRRRLSAAAKLTGKDLVIKRVGNVIYFWHRSARNRRRGRPPKTG